MWRRRWPGITNKHVNGCPSLDNQADAAENRGHCCIFKGKVLRIPFVSAVTCSAESTDNFFLYMDCFKGKNVCSLII